jgi:hypothetical protein
LAEELLVHDSGVGVGDGVGGFGTVVSWDG